MRIAVVAKKGGVGKSLVSLLLREALQRAGRAVELVDWDAQGTSTKSLDRIDKDRSKPEDAQIVIFDTPPNLDHPATRAALHSADLVLLIATPSPVDIWEAKDAAAFVKKTVSKKTRVRVLFNKVRRSTLLGRVLEETAKEMPVAVLAATLSSREAYQHFPWQGWKALDAKARQEVVQLASVVLSA